MRISNVDEKRFPARDFDIPPPLRRDLEESKHASERDDGDDNSSDLVSIDASAHDWTNYFKAGINGAARLMRKRGKSETSISHEGINAMKPLGSVGLNVLVDGQVPTGAGLSSSAAIVCASLMATLSAHGVEDVSKTELVELAIVAERAVGVNAGGYVS